MPQKLKRLVDLKIFELQSILISSQTDDTKQNQDLFSICLRWFHARHFEEVLEERVVDGRFVFGILIMNKFNIL